jgi:hypothetical protein
VWLADADALGLVGAALGLVAVVLAVAVPLSVEWARRPRLRVELGSDANRDPHWRIVHVHVVNEPLRGRLAKYLLRNPAAGCQVTMEFVSRSDRSRVPAGDMPARGKWSARPQPLSPLPVTPGTFAWVFDLEKIPQALTLDVSPSTGGEPVAVAIKHDGDAQAYAFDPEIYAYGNLRNDAFALPHEAYDVTVTAHAGEIPSEPHRFVLHNAGTAYRDLRLEPVD